MFSGAKCLFRVRSEQRWLCRITHTRYSTDACAARGPSFFDRGQPPRPKNIPARSATLPSTASKVCDRVQMSSPTRIELPKDGSTSTAVLLPGVYSPLAPPLGPLPQAAVSHLPLDICRLRSRICCREGRSRRVCGRRSRGATISVGWLSWDYSSFKLHETRKNIWTLWAPLRLTHCAGQEQLWTRSTQSPHADSTFDCPVKGKSTPS